MKKLLIVFAVLSILLVGSFAAFADPIAVPGEGYAAKAPVKYTIPTGK